MFLNGKQFVSIKPSHHFCKIQKFSLGIVYSEFDVNIFMQSSKSEPIRT